MKLNAVVETNYPAVKFWQQHGFLVSGTVP
jgi:hypothetical protein